MKRVLFSFVAVLCVIGSVHAAPQRGEASWYGEAHRGRLMANGKQFNPDELTAASWFYPLGCRVEVCLDAPGQRHKSVTVRITDRGPAEQLVRAGRIIDLSHAAFGRLASPKQGLVSVTVRRLR